jgi:hypothetical protein
MKSDINRFFLSRFALRLAYIAYPLAKRSLILILASAIRTENRACKRMVSALFFKKDYIVFNAQYETVQRRLGNPVLWSIQ